MSALDVFVDLFLVVVMRRAVVEIDDVLSAFSVLRFFTTVFPCMLVWFSLLNWQARFGKEDELWTQVIVCWTALAVLGNVINIRLCHTERFAVLISHLLLILFQKKKKRWEDAQCGPLAIFEGVSRASVMFGWLRGVVFGLKFFEKRTYCTAQFLALCLVVFLYVVLHAFTDLSIILPILIIAMVLDAIVPVVVAGFFWSSNSVPPIDSHYADERIQTFIVIAMGETVAAAGAARLSGVGVDLEGDFCVSSFLLS